MMATRSRSVGHWNAIPTGALRLSLRTAVTSTSACRSLSRVWRASCPAPGIGPYQQTRTADGPEGTNGGPAKVFTTSAYPWADRGQPAATSTRTFGDFDTYQVRALPGVGGAVTTQAIVPERTTAATQRRTPCPLSTVT